MFARIALGHSRMTTIRSPYASSGGRLFAPPYHVRMGSFHRVPARRTLSRAARPSTTLLDSALSILAEARRLAQDLPYETKARSRVLLTQTTTSS